MKGYFRRGRDEGGRREGNGGGGVVERRRGGGKEDQGSRWNRSMLMAPAAASAVSTAIHNTVTTSM